MRMRVYTQLNADRKKLMHEVQAFYKGKWIRCMEGENAMLYQSKEEAENKIKELAKLISCGKASPSSGILIKERL